MLDCAAVGPGLEKPLATVRGLGANGPYLEIQRDAQSDLNVVAIGSSDLTLIIALCLDSVVSREVSRMILGAFPYW